MTEFQEKSIILAKESLTQDVFRITVEAPLIAGSAKPGQFVMVRMQDTLDPLLRRPFSIHKVNRDGTLALLFKVIGKGTRMLSRLTTGTYFNLIGPLGKGFNLSPDAPFCLIGGGMGYLPFLPPHGSAPVEVSVVVSDYLSGRAELLPRLSLSSVVHVDHGSD